MAADHGWQRRIASGNARSRSPSTAGRPMSLKDALFALGLLQGDHLRQSCRVLRTDGERGTQHGFELVCLLLRLPSNGVLRPPPGHRTRPVVPVAPGSAGSSANPRMIVLRARPPETDAEPARPKADPMPHSAVECCLVNHQGILVQLDSEPESSKIKIAT
jgi:hypothetical protein